MPDDLEDRLIKAIAANGVKRNFSVLGGEPLCEENREFVFRIITAIRTAYPDIKICLWTGYEDEELKQLYENDSCIVGIIDLLDVIITGRYDCTLRDVSQKWYGSTNQKVHFLKT